MFLAEAFYLLREKDEAPVDPLQIEFEGYQAGFGVAGRGKHLPQSPPARGRGSLSHRLIEVIFDAHAASLSRLLNRVKRSIRCSGFFALSPGALLRPAPTGEAALLACFGWFFECRHARSRRRHLFD